MENGIEKYGRRRYKVHLTKNEHLMREMIQQNFTKSTPEIQFLTDLIYGIYSERRVSSTALSTYVSGGSKLASKQRRIERMYSAGLQDLQEVKDALRNAFGAKKVRISLDRTNWKYGKEHINAFAAFASDGIIGSLVNLKMLDNKGGNSKSTDRIELAREIIKQYGKENITNLLGDREFFSFEFVSWLVEEELPFTIRVKENLECVQEYLAIGTRQGKTFRNVTIIGPGGDIIRCDISVKKLQDEYLTLVSKGVKNPLAEYKKRWEIETFFKMLKTGGFNLEDSKITKPERLEILFLLCAMAYLICAKVGLYRHKNVEKIRWKKKDKCYEYSYFRWGLDWIKELIILGISAIKLSLSQLLPALQP